MIKVNKLNVGEIIVCIFGFLAVLLCLCVGILMLHEDSIVYAVIDFVLAGLNLFNVINTLFL